MAHSRMRILTIDFETKDPYIARGLGSGWVYSIKIPSSDFKVLGAAVITHKMEKKYVTDYEEIRRIVDQHDVLVMHNAQYDLGCLISIGYDCHSMPVYDTECMSRLYNSSLLSHSLDNIGKKYLNYRKDNQGLRDSVITHDLFPWTKKDLASREKEGDSFVRNINPAKLNKFCKENMDLIQEADIEAMSKYAIMDTQLTRDLFEFFRTKVDMKQALKYSSLAHICISYRLRGVRIDLDKARQVREELIPISVEKHQRVFDIAGEEFNLNSCVEVPRIFDKLGIEYPKTEAGNPSITTPWMQFQKHEICHALIDARKALKINRDFIEKIINMQEYTCPESFPDGRFGRIYPELHLLRARTGRFSCTSPNIQQIPSRDEIYGPMCRSIFVPEEGEKWYCLDFSNQEGRLQVHYAYKLGCKGAAELKEAFDKDPALDMHQLVADMAQISRDEAKIINLGLSYGMGITKLSETLGLTVEESKALQNKYSSLCPYLVQLNEACMESMKKKGFIKTIGGRKSHLDPSFWKDGKEYTFEYKALNKLIQGSAADQIIEAMILAHKKGLKILFPVHDELVMSGTKKQAENLKYIMEHAIVLEVPSLSEIGEGDSWAEAK